MEHHYNNQLLKYEVSPLFNCTDELVVLSHQLLYFFAYRFGIEEGVIYVSNSEGSDLHLEEMAWFNVEENNVELQKILVGADTLGYCFENKSRLLIDKNECFCTSINRPEHPRKVLSVAYLPIYFEDIKLGVVELRAKTEFTSEILDQMESFCINYANDFLNIRHAMQVEKI